MIWTREGHHNQTRKESSRASERKGMLVFCMMKEYPVTPGANQAVGGLHLMCPIGMFSNQERFAEV